VDYTCRHSGAIFTAPDQYQPHFLHDPAWPERGAGKDPVHRL